MKKHEAFTLVELLIAISIFSIIVVGLYSAFSGGVKVWRRQEEGFKYGHGIRLVMDKMAKELRCAISSDEDSGLRFTGEGKQLSFITVAGEDIAKVSYIFEKDSSGGRLKKKTVLQKEGFEEKNEKEEILITNLADASFEYAYKNDDEESLVSWGSSWGSKDTKEPPKIPKGVRITLELPVKGGKEGEDRKEIFRKTVFIPTGIIEEQK